MRSLMNTDYILRLERGQNEQKSILWMNVVLVASFIGNCVFVIKKKSNKNQQNRYIPILLVLLCSNF